jgi:hypothetical protein
MALTNSMGPRQEWLITPRQLHARIIMSKRTLDRFKVEAFISDRSYAVAREIDLLDGWAGYFPGKAAAARTLAAEWRAFAAGLHRPAV